MRARTVLALGCAIAALPLVGSAVPASAGDAASLPRITSLPDEAFTDAEREAVVAWTLAQPEVKARLGRARTRVLETHSDVAKRAAGPYRRGVVWIRNYDAGNALGVFADLSTGSIEFLEDLGAQPSQEEIDEAVEILRGDGGLADLFADPGLTLLGGFYNRSPHEDDPCRRSICLEFLFTKPSFEKVPVRHMIVDLTRRVVANHDFKRTLDASKPARMTEAQEVAK